MPLISCCDNDKALLAFCSTHCLFFGGAGLLFCQMWLNYNYANLEKKLYWFSWRWTIVYMMATFILLFSSLLKTMTVSLFLWKNLCTVWWLHRNTYKTNMQLYWCSKLHDSHLPKSNCFDLNGKQTQTQLGYNRGDWGRFNVVTWMLKVGHLFMKLQGTLPWSGPHPDHLITKLQTLYNRGHHRPVDNALWMRVSNKKN